MTDTLKNKLRSVTKDLFDRIEALEEQVTYVKRGLSEILEEEDVKDLPSYELLKQVYMEFLNSKTERSKTKEEKQDDIFDPLYAPPTTRRRNAARAKKHLAEAAMGIAVPTESPSASAASASAASSAPTYMPDFNNVNFLENINKPKQQHAASEPLTVKVKVKDDTVVYTVEIQGKQYFRYDKYLYNVDTKLRVGSIENGVFALNEQEAIQFETLEPLALNPVADTNYYSTEDNRLFIRISEESDIYQGVGELTETGDIGLWESEPDDQSK